MAERFFAPCPRGLEGALVEELGRLGAQSIAPVDGGAAFAGPLELAYRVNLESRLASRVLWQVGIGPYRDERELNALARAIDWPRQFRADRTIRVDVAATRSPLRSLEFATLTVKDAVCDRFRDEQGKRPSVDKRAADVRINAYLTDREATFYLDTSGEPLFKRGWRRDAEDAPIRENLAAGLIALSGWQPDTAFLDPMCGSGTIAIEAASMAADRAPGLARTFGFQKLAWFDGPTWQRLKQRARDRIKSAPASPLVFASDRLSAAVATTRANAALAQVDAFLHVEQADVLVRAAPASAGVIVANPPYGIRLDDKARIAAMYPKLGDALKARFAGWSAWLFSGDTELPKKIGLKADKRIPLWNGAIECRLYAYRIVSGRLEA
ncbi:MAG TPA: THUMP domain-containing protein [Casimicrobiaceae bacterium]|nr:THUMP domain-containing protein [Casimicrobiaceae bacterium]